LLSHGEPSASAGWLTVVPKEPHPEFCQVGFSTARDESKVNARVELVTDDGEVTLYIDGRQAMQAWERDLMWRSADMLCSWGSEFLEVGLGLGISALRIAGHPNTRRHRVVGKYPRVIDLFRKNNTSPPLSLEIVNADICELAPSTLAGERGGNPVRPFLQHRSAV
jgi:hypothetical protein